MSNPLRARHRLASAAFFAFAALLVLSTFPASACSPPLPQLPDLNVSDQGPGASLLIPYFEVDLIDSEGANTLIGLGDFGPEDVPPGGDATGVPVRVTLWTNLGIPVLGFDLFLVPGGAQTLNLGDILRTGRIPVTRPPEGAATVYPGCADPLENPTLANNDLITLAERLLGRPGPTGFCWALPDENDSPGMYLVKGYITVDALNDCAPLEIDAGSPSYFANGSGVASNENRLWGDVALINSRLDSAQGFRAVSLVADAERFPAEGGNYQATTFYSQLSGGDDNRRPLSSDRQMRFLQGAFDGGTDFLLWNGGFEAKEPFLCDQPPDPNVSFFGAVLRESAQGEAGVIDFSTARRIDRVAMGETYGFAADHAFGSVHLSTDLRSLFGPIPVQSWALPIFEAEGRFSVGLEGSTPGALDRFATTRGCLLDDGPGATLLMPYFEVDLDDPEGPNTLVALAALAQRFPEEDIFFDQLEPVLTRVTLWSNWGIPLLAFDVFLERGGVQTLNLRRVLAGELPASGGSREAIPFENCVSPIALPELDEGFFAELRRALSGEPSAVDSLCRSAPRGEGGRLATGFLTVDTVRACSTDLAVHPRAEGYFVDGGTGHATNDNLLWGDVILIDSSENAAQGYGAVVLPASAERYGDGARLPTFYDEFGPSGGRDNRMALYNSYRGRFFNGGPFDGGSEWLVWNNTVVNQPMACDAPFVPDGTASAVRVNGWTEAGEHLGEWFVFDPFRWTRRLPIGGDAVPVGAPFGVLEMEAVRTGGILLLPGVLLAQSWATPLLSASGRFSLAWPAAQRDRLCDTPTQP